jgi:hypothetical protein
MTLRPFKIIPIENNTYFEIHNHRGEKICTKWKLSPQFYDKLLSCPITAFGYELGIYVFDEYKNINPKFDKKDVIKALDFWIEYWVYENKKDYILEGTVNKDFELNLEELIRTREAVLKAPIDTKFVRQKIRAETTIYGIDPSGKGPNMAIFQKPNIEFTENVLETSNTPFSTVDQFCYKVKTMTRKEYEEYLKNKPHLNGILAELIRMQSQIMEGAAGRALRTEHLTSSPTLGSRIRLNDDMSVEVSEVRLSSTNPSIDPDFMTWRVSTEARSITISDDESDILTYENMHLSSMNGLNFTGDFMTIPVNFSGENNTSQITMNMFLTTRQQFNMFDGPLGTVHQIQINPNPHTDFLQIDGQTYHTTEIRISHDPRHRSIRFDNLFIESIEIGNNTARLELGQQGNGTLVRTNLSITLHNNTLGNRFQLSDFRFPMGTSLEMLGSNRVRIGTDNIYTVAEPLQINMN